MKKKYFSPQTISHVLTPVLPFAASTFSTEPQSQNITLTEDVVDEFTSRHSSVWDEEDEDF